MLSPTLKNAVCYNLVVRKGLCQIAFNNAKERTLMLAYSTPFSNAPLIVE